MRKMAAGDPVLAYNPRCSYEVLAPENCPPGGSKNLFISSTNSPIFLHPILSYLHSTPTLILAKPAACPQKHDLIWHEYDKGPQHTVHPSCPLPILVWRLSIMLRSRGDASLGPEYERETFFSFFFLF